MPLPLWKYVKNATQEPQVITDLRFVANGGIVSCVPGGLTASVGPRLTVLPGQTVKLPINIYCETARKLAWAEDVTEDEWQAALAADKSDRDRLIAEVEQLQHELRLLRKVLDDAQAAAPEAKQSSKRKTRGT